MGEILGKNTANRAVMEAVLMALRLGVAMKCEFG